ARLRGTRPGPGARRSAARSSRPAARSRPGACAGARRGGPAGEALTVLRRDPAGCGQRVDRRLDGLAQIDRVERLDDVAQRVELIEALHGLVAQMAGDEHHRDAPAAVDRARQLDALELAVERDVE